MRSTPIFRAMIVRQDSAPGDPMEGMTWVDTSGNNSDRKTWTGSQWELDIATGPDTPTHAVEGSLWNDTVNDVTKSYDGAAWSSVGLQEPQVKQIAAAYDFIGV